MEIAENILSTFFGEFVKTNESVNTITQPE